mmetsp:Transcript_21352/g.25435  ORF Transcript_21352/g.25435 Transcript_21352/m.25435 type:complete len:115 (+) Transcript_21352:577-921(+)
MRIITDPICTAAFKTVGLSSTPSTTVQAKNGMARRDMMAGVDMAPTRQPKSLIMLLPIRMTTSVEAPTSDEKFPIKRWYSIGSSYCLLTRDFQLISRKLYIIPYPNTRVVTSPR